MIMHCPVIVRPSEAMQIRVMLLVSRDNKPPLKVIFAYDEIRRTAGHELISPKLHVF
jgi:hypothetical protein